MAKKKKIDEKALAAAYNEALALEKAGDFEKAAKESRAISIEKCCSKVSKPGAGLSGFLAQYFSIIVL